MTSIEKQVTYRALVNERKDCRRCVGLRNPSDPALALYDSDEIGPWTRLHGDLDAELMVIGQDWGDIRYFQTNLGLDDLKNPTMQTLGRLLKGIGISVSLVRYGDGPKGLFLTNAVLCLKQGGLQASVQQDWFDRCGAHFLRQQVEIVSPRVVVTLGQKSYTAALKAFGLRAGTFRSAVEDPAGTRLPNGSQLLPVYHCGNRILNTHRPFVMQQKDWKRVARALGTPCDDGV